GDEPDAAFALDIFEFTAHGLQEQYSPPGAGSLQTELRTHPAAIAHIDQRSTCLSIRPVLPSANAPSHGLVPARVVHSVDAVTPSFRDLARDPGTATPGTLPIVAGSHSDRHQIINSSRVFQPTGPLPPISPLTGRNPHIRRQLPSRDCRGR